MRSVRDAVNESLEWIQPAAMVRAFELKSGDETLATLAFRSVFGSLAIAEAAEGRWTFKRMGFFQARVSIRAEGAETDLASFRNNTWSAGGTLDLPDGRQYHANSNFWATSYEFKTETDETLVKFTRVRGVLHLSSKVEIASAGARLAELPWLVALGWYLTVKMHDDASGAAAAGAAAG